MTSVKYRRKNHGGHVWKWSQCFGCMLWESQQHHCQVSKAANFEVMLPLFIAGQLCHRMRWWWETQGSYPTADKHEPKLLQMNFRWSMNHGGICSISSRAKNSNWRHSLLELTLKTQREAKADSTLTRLNLPHMPLYISSGSPVIRYLMPVGHRVIIAQECLQK